MSTRPFNQAPRSAYIHVPFCRHRCGYCNFTLVAGRDDLVDAFLEAIERELRHLDGPREVDTLFFGGGTPTHLPAPQLARLIAIARKSFPLAAGGEFSVEANPIDLDRQQADVLAAGGVTRISLGVQSFHPWKLTALERDHTSADIESAFRLARNVAESVSVDLIFGIPGESLAAWQQDLDMALALKPDHVSTYGLTFEKGTSFWGRLLRGELVRVDEDQEREFYLAAIDTLTAAGYEHYEVSNFARPGDRCRHNETYWTGGGYYAAGPGAARFIGGKREINHRSTTTYIRRVLDGQSPMAESEQLPPQDAARERLVFALRRLEGVDLNEFHRETGFNVAELVGKRLPSLLELGLLEQIGSQLRLTRSGLLISDSIWPQFLNA